MRYKLFGRSGLRVSELCLGTMTFANDWRSVRSADPEQSRAIFDTFAEAGGNFIDTAHLYSYQNTSGESLVGDFIRSERDRFVVSTKYSLDIGVDLARSGNSRKNMMRCVEDSLRRLGSDYIDIYWLHMWDGTTPMEEILRGFDDLVSSGKVLYVAISGTPAWQISRATVLAELRGWAPFCGIQVEYNLLERTADRELLPMAEELDLGVCGWSPLGRGKLVQRSASPDGLNATNTGGPPEPERQRAIVEMVAGVAEKMGCTQSQIALSAIRQITQPNSVIPILGARTVEQMKDNLGCLQITLGDEHLHLLEGVSSVELGFPHTILKRIRPLAFGGHASSLDHRRRR